MAAMSRGLRRWFVLALGLAVPALGAGCTYVVARIARLEPAGLRMCNVAIGALATEVREMCGEPDAIVPAFKGADRCWLYRSTADYRLGPRVWLVNPRYTVDTAPWVAVCMVNEKKIRRDEYQERAVLVEFLSEGPVGSSTSAAPRR